MIKQKSFGILLFLLCLDANAGWTGQIKEDVVTGEKYGLATVEAERQVRFGKPYLAVRCGEKIRLFAYMGSYLNDDGPLVAIARVDDQKPLDLKGSPSTDGTAFYFRRSGTSYWIKKLIKGTKLSIGVFDYRGVRQDAVFSAIGFTRAFTNACDWHPEFARKYGGQP